MESKPKKILLSCIALLLLLIAFTPMILTSNFGKKRILSYLEHSWDGKIQVETFNLSTFHSQFIQNFSFTSNDHAINFSVKEIVIESSLLSFLLKGGNVGEILVDSPKLNVFPNIFSKRSPSSEKKTIFPIAGNLNLKDGTIFIDSSNIAKTRFENINITLDLQTSRKRLVFELSCQAFQKGTAGNFHIQGDFTRQKSFINDLKMDISNFPLDSVDELIGIINPSAKGKLTSALGSTLNVNLQSVSNGNQLEYFFSASSPLLTISKIHLTQNQTLMLSGISTISYKLTEEFIQKFLGDQKILLKSPVYLSGTINELSIPIKHGRFPDFKQIVATLNFPSNDLFFTRIHDLLDVDFKEFTFDVTANGLKNIAISGTSLVNFDENSLLFPLTSQNINLSFDLIANALDPSFPKIELSLIGDSLKATMLAELNPAGDVIFLKPLLIDLKPDPKLFNTKMNQYDYFPKMVSSDPMHLEVMPDRLGYKLKGNIDRINFSSKNDQYGFHLAKILLDGNYHQTSKALTVDFSANAMEEALAVGNVQGSFEYQNEALQKFDTKISDLSTLIVDSFFHLKQELPKIVGETINLDISYGEDLYIAATCPNLKMQANFNLGTDLTLKQSRNPMSLEWKMTDAGYSAMNRLRNKQGITHLQLTKPAKVSLALSMLQVQKNAIQKYEWNDALFDGSLSLSDVSFKEKNQPKITTLEKFVFDAKKTKESAPLTFKINSSISTDGSSSGTIDAEGNALNYTDTKGDFALSNIQSNFTGVAKNLPTLFIDAMFQLMGLGKTPPSAFLGKYLNASIKGNLHQGSGRLNLDIDATSCKTSIDAAIANGNMLLLKPLEATLQITDSLSQLLLSNMDLSINAAKNPMQLYIDPKGFSIPLQNYDIRNAKINFGRLDFGKIVVKNTGNPSEISSIFKLNNNRSRMIDLWFAPCEFSLRDGVLSLDRTEMLFQNAYEIAFWGNIDLYKQYVNMILGLTEQSLSATLGIKDMPKGYVLPVPLKGPYGKVTLHKNQAIAQIALLLAGEAGKGQSSPFGNLLGALGQIARQQSNIPKAKHPFPWEK